MTRLAHSDMVEGLVETGKVSATAVPLERHGNLEDMAGLVLYLVSRAGSYTNGGVFLTDGGRLGLFASSY